MKESLEMQKLEIEANGLEAASNHGSVSQICENTARIYNISGNMLRDQFGILSKMART